MRKLYVCLNRTKHENTSCNPGEIIVLESSPGISWASFDPPPELEGVPQFEESFNEAGNTKIFRYHVRETGQRFIIRGQFGIPGAICKIEADTPHRHVKVMPDPDGKVPNRCGLENFVSSAAYSYCRWVPAGHCV